MDNELIRQVVLRVNGKDAEDNLKRLQATIEQTRKKREEFEKANPNRAEWTKAQQKEWKDFGKTIKDAEIQVKRFGTTSDAVKNTLDNLTGASVKELQKSLRSLQQTLNSGGVKRGSEEWKQLTEAISRTKKEIQGIKQEYEGKKFGKLADKGREWVGATTILSQLGNTIIGLYTFIYEKTSAAINAFASMDSAIRDVGKYTGMTDEELKKLNEDFRKIDTATPREKLNALAADAGRLGLQSRADILAFVEAADQINVALGEDLGADAVKNIGKLAQMFGDDQRLGLKQAMLSTGSVINELAQSSSASEGYIMEFTQRLAGVARQAGMTQAQIMAFAAVLDQQAVGVEKGATALQNVITALYRKPAELANAAGLDVKQFAELLKKDGNGALLQFAAAIGRAGTMDTIAPMLDKMKLSGAGVTQTLSALAGNIDTLRQTQQQATEAFRSGQSVTEEAAKQQEKVASRLEMARNKAAETAVSLGESLWPAYIKVLDGSSKLMDILRETITWMGRNAGTVLTVTAAVAAYTAAETLSIAAIRAKITQTTIAIRSSLAYRIAQQAAAAGTAMASLATNLFRRNTQAAAVALGRLRILLLSNPWTAAATAILAIGIAIYKLATRTRELTKQQLLLQSQQKDWQSVTEKVNQHTAEQISRIRLLDAVMRDNNRSMAERKRAAAELNRIIPGYNAHIDKSTGNLKANTQALDKHIEALKRDAMAQAMQEQMASIMSERLVAEQSLARRRGGVYNIRGRISLIDRETEGLLEAGGVYDRQRMRNIARELGKSEAWVVQMHQKRQQELGKLREMEKLVEQQQDVADRIDKRTDTLINTARRLGLDLSAPIGEPVAGTEVTQREPSTPLTTDAQKREKRETDEEQLKAQAEKRRVEEAARYVSGEQTYHQYRMALLHIDEEYYTKAASLYDSTSQESGERRRKAQEASRKQRDTQALYTLEAQRKDYEAELDLLSTKQALGLISEEQYQRERDQKEEAYLEARLLRLRENSAEAETIHQAEQKLEEARQRQLQEQRQRYNAQLLAWQQQLGQLTLEEQENLDIQLLEEIRKALSLTEAEYSKALEGIRQLYKKKRQEQTDGKSGAGGSKREETPADPAAAAVAQLGRSIHALAEPLKDGEEKWKRYADVAQGSLALIGTGIQSVSALFQAEQQLEEARVTERYATEIEKAGENTKRGRELEEQKQKELAKIKNKYNKRSMAIEIAQAMATTAQNALQAYGAVLMPHQPWTIPLAIAAAAAATASGMIQVAAIKKQHEAQAAGYYEGGFTGGTDYRREAGIVHQGEFVANHKSLRNPSLVPLFRLIDHAQRNGTVADLTAADVSRVVAAPQLTAIAAQNTAATIHTRRSQTTEAEDRNSQEMADTLRRLARQLEGGIRATVAITGEDGLERQWNRYRQLTARR
ncbi:MAG: phage tail tape measure protein [Alloprevotella sp.]